MKSISHLQGIALKISALPGELPQKGLFMKINRFWITILFLSGFVFTLYGQYFGQNKPKYQHFNFSVAETNHFEIYHYLPEDTCLLPIAHYLEKWYSMHLEVLRDSVYPKIPFILYNNHPEFQQTNAVSGEIGVGTGGVTEGLKNRIILPFAPSNQQTHHVIGHELVHAFQYDMILNGDSTSIQSLQNIPLWMIEGMAEYLSIGRYDPLTAMWMRDAVFHEDVPDLIKLNNTSRYFPYRYGQAFWTFISTNYGDNKIAPLFIQTARFGLEIAVPRVLGLKLHELSENWVTAITNYYSLILKDSSQYQTIGNTLIDEHNGGKINLSPSVSPNGQLLTFFSEKDLFSFDLFLADVQSGNIIKKLASITRDGHLDDYNSIESVGAWSPDNKKFATIGIQKGKNQLVIIDIITGKKNREITVPHVPAFNSLAWSPDGSRILLTGQVNGQTDLFSYNLDDGLVTRLTNDRYTEWHPSWNADGSKITFATDQLSQHKKRIHGKWTADLAILDLTTHSRTILHAFPGANNLNPLFDTNGNILFISDRTGTKNLYRYDMSSQTIFQLTNLRTGISGMTSYAPALSFSTNKDLLLFTAFNNGSYLIQKTFMDELTAIPVRADEVFPEASAILPTTITPHGDLVNRQLDEIDRQEGQPTVHLTHKTFKPKFKLDYVGGSAGVGVGVSSLGPATGLAGGIDLLFSDILGDQLVYSGIALNGQIYDFAGLMTYINRKSRVQWGATVSHIPLTYGEFFYMGMDTLVDNDTEDRIPVEHYATLLTRQFQDRASLFGKYQFSRTFRIETGTAFNRYSYRIEQYNSYIQNGITILESKEKLPKPEGFNLASIELAAVGDNAFFGIASPSIGYRFRVGVERYTGRWKFWALTADFRKYFFVKPFTLAFRGLHYGRYGEEKTLSEVGYLYVGNSALVRGYSILNFTEGPHPLALEDLVGSKLLVANAEVRIPLTGPKRLAVLSSRFIFTEFALFSDAGVAWKTFDQFTPNADLPNDKNQVQPIYSAGFSLRINFFGALILEPYYAFQLKQDGHQGMGINFIPGW